MHVLLERYCEAVELSCVIVSCGFPFAGRGQKYMYDGRNVMCQNELNLEIEAKNENRTHPGNMGVFRV